MGAERSFLVIVRRLLGHQRTCLLEAAVLAVLALEEAIHPPLTGAIARSERLIGLGGREPAREQGVGRGGELRLRIAVQVGLAPRELGFRRIGRHGKAGRENRVPRGAVLERGAGGGRVVEAPIPEAAEATAGSCARSRRRASLSMMPWARKLRAQSITASAVSGRSRCSGGTCAQCQRKRPTLNRPSVDWPSARPVSA